jgi:hypothetical protein
MATASGALAGTHLERAIAAHDDYVALQQVGNKKGSSMYILNVEIDPRIAGAAVALAMTFLETSLIFSALAL